MQEIKERALTGERALFASKNLRVADCTFENGESPLKESENIELSGCMFKWKYPLWYCKNVTADNCTLFETARAGIWYTDNIVFKNGIIEAPKTFRRSENIYAENTIFVNAQETLWNCRRVKLKNVTAAKGDYFAMNASDLTADGFNLAGNYAFDGAENVVIRNAKMLTKDAFWNSKNVTVYDSFISGEYLGWNAQNLTLINCTVESLQGMCYINNLIMKNCKLLNTTLAFEYSSVQADITNKIDSVLNPTSGRIEASEIGELIIQKDRVNPDLTVIICRDAKRNKKESA